MKKLIFVCLLFSAVLFAGVNPVNNSGFVQYLIEENTDPDVSLSVYPNPVRDFVNIEVKGQSKKKITRISFHNILGTEVLSKRVNGDSKIKLNIRNFKRGKYLVRVYFADGKMAYTNLVKV